ncbi:MAG: DNA topoisomerase IB [Verrucomicrobiota bacterium]|nr:DNA topoisomerase IB [Verrucomicrobiota bacterium]
MGARSSTAKIAEKNPFLAALVSEARGAGLQYYSDTRPGIRRRPRGKEFVFVNPDGSRVTDQATLVRIKRLAIPPAWENVWICPSEDGHIQATGRDARRRKQYRYHAEWRKQRDENKFGRILAFARALPGIRRAVKRDLARAGMPREKVLATVVRLLETTLIRIGNDEYARQNRSYGLTTMRDHHVKVSGEKISFSFRGKSGKQHTIDVTDRHLAKIVKHCQDLPGQELFGYVDDKGEHRDVTSQDVNDYLRAIAGEDFTAKDFRTWTGTVLAAMALREFQQVTSKAQAKKNVVAAIESVAKLLGNTPAVCRKCYVHPEILDSYLQGTTVDTLDQQVRKTIDRSLPKLSPEEALVVGFLEGRLRTARNKSPRFEISNQ